MTVKRFMTVGQWGIKVPKSKGESFRRYLLGSGGWCPNLKPVADGDFLIFPIVSDEIALPDELGCDYDIGRYEFESRERGREPARHGLIGGIAIMQDDDPAEAERGLVAIGFFQDQTDIENSPMQQFGQVKVGDIKYQDVNGDGVINENDYVAQDYGNTFPSLNYAFTVGAEYKGFGINATLQGAAHQVKNLRYVDGVWGALSDNRNLSKEYYNNCFDTAGSGALYPRLSTENVANNAQNSTTWYRNISWLKMRDCEVYYKLPAKVIQPLKITAVRVFVQGQNLLSFDNIDAMDAENLNTGYPVMKGVNMGLNVTF